jgi:atypical dual specificity phosphatase
MAAPRGFSWIKRPLLAGLAMPRDREEFTWLRAHGIQVLLSLSEDPARRDLVNDAGLMSVHEPIDDFTAPSVEQLERCVSVIDRAHAQNMGVAVHCGAGKGRTGTILAAWLVSQGQPADEAINRIRELRPGSLEVEEQEEAVREFARRRSGAEPA